MAKYQQFNKNQIAALRQAWGSIEGIDPSSFQYKSLIVFLDNQSQEMLHVLADAGIKWVSMLANNRLHK